MDLIMTHELNIVSLILFDCKMVKSILSMQGKKATVWLMNKIIMSYKLSKSVQGTWSLNQCYNLTLSFNVNGLNPFSDGGA